MIEAEVPWTGWALTCLAVAAAVTYFWRGLGVAFSGRIDPASPLFEWVGCVAYALLAGLISRMILLPVGALEATEVTHRIAAAVIALAIFFVTRRNLAFGLAAGVGVLVLFTWGRFFFD